MVEIKNRDDLERWLKDRPREVAVVIAARAALRVLPLLVTALDEDAEARRGTLVLPVFRALAAPWVAAVGATQGAVARKAAVYAAAGTDAATAAADTAVRAYVAAYAARTAAAAAARAAYADKSAAAAAAAAAADAAAHAAAAAWEVGLVVFHSDGSGFDDGTGYWQPYSTASAAAASEAVSVDTTALEQGQSPERVAATPLWPENLPDWAADAWAKFENHLLKAGEGWKVWTGWYQDRLNGKQPYIPLEEDRALIASETWAQGPKAVNAEIARLIEEYSITGVLAATDTPDTASISVSVLPQPVDVGRQSTNGLSFGGSIDGRIELVDPSQAGEARDDEIGREFHGEVRSVALELQDRCKRSNQLYALGEALRKYVDRLGSGPGEVRRTLILYGEMLRNLRDADLRSQEATDPIPEPMPEDAFAALQTLIAAHNQYVSTDPALASLVRALMDPEDAASVVVLPDETLEALDDLAPVLDGAAQEVLRDAAEAAKPNTPAGRRALVWLDQSWRNLAIETSRRVLYALRKSAEAFYDEAVIAARLTTGQAIEAAREMASLALRRVKQGAAGFVAIEAGPGAVQALADFAAHVDAVGRVVRTGETIASAAATTFGVGLGGILLVVIVARHLAGKAWFVDLIDNPEVKKVIELLRPK